MAEAGKRFGITGDSFKVLLNQYKDQLQGYYWKQRYLCSISGQHRRMTVITEQGMIMLATLKDSDHGNRRKTLPGRVFTEAKKEIVEKAIAATMPAPQASSIQILLETVKAMAEMESRTNQRFDQIEKERQEEKQQRDQARELMGILPVAGTPLPEMSTRKKIAERINKYASINENYEDCRKLFNLQVYYRLGINIMLMVKNRRKAGDKYYNGMDAIEERGKMEEAFALCCELFKI